jgi:uncharacterized membrane protein
MSLERRASMSFFSGALGALAVLLVLGVARRAAWHRHFHGHHGHGGRPWMLRRLFQRLGTRPEQEQVMNAEADALASELRALRTEAHALRAEVADLLAGPALDASRIAAALDSRRARVEAVKSRLAEGLAKIHATLDPAQRTQLAAMVRAGPHRAHCA